MYPSMFEMFNEGEQKSGPTEISPLSHSPAGNFFSISIGGSILIDDKPDVDRIAKFSETINRLQQEGYKFALVVGGGKTCRNYQAAAKALGANNYFLDEIGIKVTRINASLLTQTIDNAFQEVLTDVSRVADILSQGKVPIFGGLLPGITTDAVAALIAERMQGTFINLSNVDGIYSSDPRKSAGAKFYPELSYERLVGIIQLAEAKPGQNVVLDLPAALILKRSVIRALFLNGDDLENFESAVRGGSFNGTVVCEGTLEEEPEAKTTRRRVAKRRKSRVKEEIEDEEYTPPEPDEIDF